MIKGIHVFKTLAEAQRDGFYPCDQPKSDGTVTVRATVNGKFALAIVDPKAR